MKTNRKASELIANAKKMTTEDCENFRIVTKTDKYFEDGFMRNQTFTAVEFDRNGKTEFIGTLFL